MQECRNAKMPECINAGEVFSHLGLPAADGIQLLHNRLFVSIELGQARPLQEVVEGHPQYAKAIPHTSSEIDGGSLFEVFRRAGYLGDVVAAIDDLGEHFIVEDEIVGIEVEADAGKHFPAESPVAGMVFG